VLGVIHCEPQVAWQRPFAAKLADGLRAIGIDSRITNSRGRLDEGFPILLGTTFWRAIETPPYLLVDRCSFGDTNQYVSLVWNGHGKRGDHCVPEGHDASRWALHGVALMPWRYGERAVLCGQTETYSPTWDHIEDWYASHSEATHFRRHPAGEVWRLPLADTFTDAGTVITLNSSVAIEALILGRHVTVDDAGGMAYGWSSREQLMHWLAWTQWHHEEIRTGKPIAHLFDQVAS